jgi:hypothetical protein
MSEMNMEGEPELPAHLDAEAARELLEEVLEAEKARLHMKNPRGVRQEIEETIRSEVE